MPHGSDGIYTPDPGECDEAFCTVCGSKMDVKRGVEGPTSWAMAMAKATRKYDLFKCPNIGMGWHKQAKAILAEAHKTTSSGLASMMRSEAALIVETQKPTQEGWADDE